MAEPNISNEEIVCELTKSAIRAGLIRPVAKLPLNELDTLAKNIVSFYKAAKTQLAESTK